jgi:hypothetical protein
MGHSSITVTAEIYARLFDSELDQVSDALDVLTEGVAESVYMPKIRLREPRPSSGRAPWKGATHQSFIRARGPAIWRSV